MLIVDGLGEDAGLETGCVCATIEPSNTSATESHFVGASQRLIYFLIVPNLLGPDDPRDQCGRNARGGRTLSKELAVSKLDEVSHICSPECRDYGHHLKGILIFEVVCLLRDLMPGGSVAI